VGLEREEERRKNEALTTTGKAERKEWEENHTRQPSIINQPEREKERERGSHKQIYTGRRRERATTTAAAAAAEREEKEKKKKKAATETKPQKRQTAVRRSVIWGASSLSGTTFTHRKGEREGGRGGVSSSFLYIHDDRVK